MAMVNFWLGFWHMISMQDMQINWSTLSLIKVFSYQLSRNYMLKTANVKLKTPNFLVQLFLSYKINL
jgi:hypothetical protein